MGWERYVGAAGAVVGMTGFGASAPGGTVMEKFGFTGERVRDAVLLGVACALQGLTSNYLLVFTAVAAGVALVVRANEWVRPPSGRTAALVALAAAVAVAMVGPFLYPYYLTQREQGEETVIAAVIPGIEATLAPDVVQRVDGHRGVEQRHR